jgi:hypothetical protein
MSKVKRALLSVVCVVTIASLVTGCCCGLEALAPALQHEEGVSQEGPAATAPGEEYESAGYAAGEYSIQHTAQTQRSTEVTYPYDTFSDFTAEVDVRFAADVDYTLGGLLFRWQDEENYYGFLVWNDGRYGLFKRVDGEFEELLSGSTAYLDSVVSANRLKVVVVGDSISLYVNDQHVNSLNDSSFQEGRVGLHATVHSETPVSTQVYFDNLLVSGPEETSAVIFEDDFSDPSSGWPIEEYAYGSVGYVAATGAGEAVEIYIYPTPTPEAWEPVEIVSERELAAEEFFRLVEGDERFEDVYALAEEQGYTEPLAAREFRASDGSVMQSILLTSAMDQLVIAFRIYEGQTSTALLLRAEGEGETVILYDRQGRAEITVVDEETVNVTVFDAAGNAIGASDLGENSRPAGLASGRRQIWGDPWSWKDFNHCLQRWSGGWRRTGATLVEATGSLGAALAGGTGAISGGGAGVIAAAVFFGVEVWIIEHCFAEAGIDDPPTAVPESRRKIGTCETSCVTGPTRVQYVCTEPKYRIEFALDDDRGPAEGPDCLELCAGDTGTLTVRDNRVRGPQTTTVEHTAPEIDLETDCTACPDAARYCSLETLTCVQCRRGYEDCAEREECVEGKCVKRLCQNDGDCGRGLRCVEGDCVECVLDEHCAPDEECVGLQCQHRGAGAFDRLALGALGVCGTYDSSQCTVFKDEMLLGFPSEGGAVYGTAHFDWTFKDYPENPDYPARSLNQYLTFEGTFTPPATLKGTYRAEVSGIEVFEPPDMDPLWREEPYDDRWSGDWEGTIQDDGSLRIVIRDAGTGMSSGDYQIDLALSRGVWNRRQLTVD